MIADINYDSGESCRLNGKVDQHLQGISSEKSWLCQHHVTIHTNNYCHATNMERLAPHEKWHVEKIHDWSFLGTFESQIKGIHL